MKNRMFVITLLLTLFGSAMAFGQTGSIPNMLDCGPQSIVAYSSSDGPTIKGFCFYMGIATTEPVPMFPGYPPMEIFMRDDNGTVWGQSKETGFTYNLSLASGRLNGAWSFSSMGYLVQNHGQAGAVNVRMANGGGTYQVSFHDSDYSVTPADSLVQDPDASCAYAATAGGYHYCLFSYGTGALQVNAPDGTVRSYFSKGERPLQLVVVGTSAYVLTFGKFAGSGQVWEFDNGIQNEEPLLNGVELISSDPHQSQMSGDANGLVLLSGGGNIRVILGYGLSSSIHSWQTLVQGKPGEAIYGLVLAPNQQ